MRALVVILLLATTSVAAAEPRKNPRTGFWLSLGVTAGGLAVALVGADVGIRPQAYGNTHALEPTFAGIGAAAMVVGPSLGRVYGGAPLWNKGLEWRLAGLGVMAIGAVTAVEIGRHQAPSDGPVDVGPLLIGGGIALIGAGMFIGGASYEIATTPTAIRASDGSLAPALALTGRF